MRFCFDFYSYVFYVMVELSERYQVFLLMVLLPPRSTLTDTRCPYTTLCRAPTFDVRGQLEEIGFEPMQLFLPEEPDEDTAENLWSKKSGFARSEEHT